MWGRVQKRKKGTSQEAPASGQLTDNGLNCSGSSEEDS